MLQLFRWNLKTNAVSRNMMQSTTRAFASLASIRLYRILVRKVQQELPSEILLQPPFRPRDLVAATKYKPNREHFDNFIYILGSFFSWHERDKDTDDELIQSWYKSVSGNINIKRDLPGPWSCWATRQDIQVALRYAFRHSPSNCTAIALVASRDISLQATMWECTSVSMEQGIRIVATSSYTGSEGSSSTDERYRFVYRIRVENLDPHRTVQLLGRTWRIQDCDVQGNNVGNPIIVNGSTTGAVGHQPVLHPGAVFEYNSGCHLTTTQGTMRGLLHMAFVDEDTPDALVGDQVDALQPEFTGVRLEVPVTPFALKVCQ